MFVKVLPGVSGSVKTQGYYHPVVIIKLVVKRGNLTDFKVCILARKLPVPAQLYRGIGDCCSHVKVDIIVTAQQDQNITLFFMRGNSHCEHSANQDEDEIRVLFDTDRAMHGFSSRSRCATTVGITS